MTRSQVSEVVRGIVRDACGLKELHTGDATSPVNYVALFAQTSDEYEALFGIVSSFGKVVQDTPTGPLFHIDPIDTIAGPVKLLKVRQPDSSRPERGDADFTLPNYEEFKEAYLPRSGFSLIRREHFEMIELADPSFDVLAYFSHPPLDVQLGIS